MITAISIVLYAVAVFCAMTAGHELGLPSSKKQTVSFFLAACLFFIAIAALLQIFG